MPIYGPFSPEFVTCPATVEWYLMLPEGQTREAHVRCVKQIEAKSIKTRAGYCVNLHFLSQILLHLVTALSLF